MTPNCKRKFLPLILVENPIWILLYPNAYQQREGSITSCHVPVTVTYDTLGLVSNWRPSLHRILLLCVSFIPDLTFCPSSRPRSAIFSGRGSFNAQRLSDVTFHTPDSCTTITLTLMHWHFPNRLFVLAKSVMSHYTAAPLSPTAKLHLFFFSFQRFMYFSLCGNLFYFAQWTLAMNLDILILHRYCAV